jgi:hypothetical protein
MQPSIHDGIVQIQQILVTTNMTMNCCQSQRARMPRPFWTRSSVAGLWLLLLLHMPAWGGSDGAQCLQLSTIGSPVLWGEGKACNLAQGKTAKQLIDHAETYLWLGMHERGDRNSFRCGLDYLQAAETLLKQPPGQQHNNEPTLNRQLQALKQNLQRQLQQTNDTLYGQFPLSRLLVPTLFLDWESTATYDLIDYADDVAVRLGTETLIEQVLEHWEAKAQLPVLIRSELADPDGEQSHRLENEALYVINRHPKLFPHLERQWLGATANDEENDKALDPDHHSALIDEIGHPRPLIFSIKNPDCVDGNYRFLIEGRIYDDGGTKIETQINAYGLARERHHELWSIATAHALLFLIALALVAWLERRRLKCRLPQRDLWSLTVAAFGLGRLLPWVAITAMLAIAPQPEAVLLVSAWWPVLAGIVLFGLPVLV